VRITIDIPDETYRQLEVVAANEGRAVGQIILRAIQKEIGPPPSDVSHQSLEV